MKKLFTLLLVLLVSITSVKGLESSNYKEIRNTNIEYFVDYEDVDDPINNSGVA